MYIYIYIYIKSESVKVLLYICIYIYISLTKIKENMIYIYIYIYKVGKYLKLYIYIIHIIKREYASAYISCVRHFQKCTDTILLILDIGLKSNTLILYKVYRCTYS